MCRGRILSQTSRRSHLPACSRVGPEQRRSHGELRVPADLAKQSARRRRATQQKTPLATSRPTGPCEPRCQREPRWLDEGFCSFREGEDGSQRHRPGLPSSTGSSRRMTPSRERRAPPAASSTVSTVGKLLRGLPSVQRARHVLPFRCCIRSEKIFLTTDAASKGEKYVSQCPLFALNLSRSRRESLFTETRDPCRCHGCFRRSDSGNRQRFQAPNNLVISHVPGTSVFSTYPKNIRASVDAS